jgi:DNA-binding transcriptional ArsR family regulator
MTTTLTEPPSDLPTMCAALGEPMRWEILTRLGQEALSASALARLLPVSRQAIGKHLKTLTEVGLVAAERRGREVVYVAVGARLNVLARELDRIGTAWDRRLSALKRLAEGTR